MTRRWVIALLLLSHAAWARPHVRRHFEPTDLQLETPGTSELDLENGMVRGPTAWRVVAPDFELDVGLTKWLELDVDGAYAVEGRSDAPFTFDHAAPDPLWPSAKVGLVDAVDAQLSRTYALGAQLGPRLPTYAGAHGVGAEGLLLAGIDFGLTSLTWNVGGFVDPAPAPDTRRPVGVQTGFDISEDLDAAARYTLTGSVSGVAFTSHDPAQLQATFGPSYAPTPWLHLSLTGLVGVLPGSDRYGILLGVAPRLPLWHGT